MNALTLIGLIVIVGLIMFGLQFGTALFTSKKVDLNRWRYRIVFKDPAALTAYLTEVDTQEEAETLIKEWGNGTELTYIKINTGFK